MKILFLLNDGPDASSGQWIEALSQNQQLEVVDLTAKDVAYDTIVDKIFASDRVISW